MRFLVILHRLTPDENKTVFYGFYQSLLFPGGSCRWYRFSSSQRCNGGILSEILWAQCICASSESSPWPLLKLWTWSLLNHNHGSWVRTCPHHKCMHKVTTLTRPSSSICTAWVPWLNVPRKTALSSTQFTCMWRMNTILTVFMLLRPLLWGILYCMFTNGSARLHVKYKQVRLAIKKESCLHSLVRLLCRPLCEILDRFDSVRSDFRSALNALEFPQLTGNQSTRTDRQRQGPRKYNNCPCEWQMRGN